MKTKKHGIERGIADLPLYAMAPARSILNLCLVGIALFLAAGCLFAEPLNDAKNTVVAKPNVPRWCSAMRDYYEALLMNQERTPPFQVLQSFGPYDNGNSAGFPRDFKPHDTPYDPDDEPPQLTFSIQKIDGHPVALVNVIGSHDCSATNRVEVWSADLKHYLGSVDDALNHSTDRGDTTSLVLIETKKYLMEVHYLERPDEIDVVGFAPDLAPALRCRIDIDYSQPEKILSSSDGDVCEAVRSGHVNEVPMETMEDRHLERASFGAIPLEFEDEPVRDYQILKWGLIDLGNDGHPTKIAMVRSSGDRGMGCGFANLAWEWPVVLGADGRPNLDSKINLLTSRAGNQISRLISYQGKVYVDSRSLPNENAYSHTVAKISATDITVICKFMPVRYVVAPLPIQD